MAVSLAAAIFPAGGFSPVPRRPLTFSGGKPKWTNHIFPAAGNVAPRVSGQAPATVTPPYTAAQQGRIGKEWLKEVEESERRGLRLYCEEAAEMVTTGLDGGPPRWFSPLECAPASSGLPLLLYLPGVDGIGLGLVTHHEKLAKMFEVWCLHIPPMDRTPFTGLVKLVEETVKSQNHRSPNSPVYLVGEFLGGCLALAVAARNPKVDLVLVLANPATLFNQSSLEAMPDQARSSLRCSLSVMVALAGISLSVMVALAGIFSLSVMVALAGQFLEMMMPQRSRDSMHQTVGELLLSSYPSVLDRTLPKEALVWKLKLLKEASAYANSHLHAVTAQTLILSSGSLLPNRVESERLHRALPKCELCRFNHSGHSLFLDGGFDLGTVIKDASFYRRSKHVDYITDYVPLTPSEIKNIRDSFRLLYSATSPVMFSTLESGKVVRGLAGIPSEGPVLLVGYHPIFGMELVPLALELFIQRNIVVRGLAHPMMFKKVKQRLIPVSMTSLFHLFTSPLFRTFRTLGAVPVTATNLFKLLSSKSHALLYPGGVREAFHRKGEQYKLFWPENAEFVRTAARFGAKIVPFGVVGEDDFGEVVFDYDDMMKIPFFKNQIEELAECFPPLRTDATGELANQGLHLPGILPKPPGGRLYFYFGKPIETQGKTMELKDKEKAQEMYMEVKSEVENCLAYLKEKRKSDPYRNLVTRLFYRATHGFDSEIPTFEL